MVASTHVRLGSGWPPPKSSKGVSFTRDSCTKQGRYSSTSAQFERTEDPQGPAMRGELPEPLDGEAGHGTTRPVQAAPNTHLGSSELWCSGPVNQLADYRQPTVEGEIGCSRSTHVCSSKSSTRPSLGNNSKLQWPHPPSEGSATAAATLPAGRRQERWGVARGYPQGERGAGVAHQGRSQCVHKDSLGIGASDGVHGVKLEPARRMKNHRVQATHGDRRGGKTEQDKPAWALSAAHSQLPVTEQREERPDGKEGPRVDWSEAAELQRGWPGAALAGLTGSRGGRARPAAAGSRTPPAPATGQGQFSSCRHERDGRAGPQQRQQQWRWLTMHTSREAVHCPLDNIESARERASGN
jgi:hypothetical protein